MISLPSQYEIEIEAIESLLRPSSRFIQIPEGVKLPSGKRIADQMAILLNYLQMRTLMKPANKRSYFVDIPWMTLRRLMGDGYNLIYKSAKTLGYIDHTGYNSGWYKSKNVHTRGYRLTERFRHGRAKPYELQTNPMIKRNTRSRKIDIELLGDNGRHIVSKLNDIELDSEAASADPANRPYHRRQAVSNWLNGEHYACRDEQGRLHTLVTNQPTTVRPYLSCAGQPLSILDYANFQPLLMGILVAASEESWGQQVMRKGTSKEPSKGKSIKHPSINPSSVCACTESVPPFLGSFVTRQFWQKDVLEWVKLCEAGQLYRYLYDSIQALGKPAWTEICSDRGCFRKDLREDSYPSFKRHSFVPIMGSIDLMRGNPLFHIIQRDFPTIGRWVIDSKVDAYQATSWTLQRFESNMVIDQIGQRFREDRPDITVGTIHDALMVPEQHSEYAESLMVDAFADFEVTPKVKEETTNTPTSSETSDDSGNCLCGCGKPVTQPSTGRPKKYATPACRVRYHRT